jgi:filamentous hemagglutinin family protein
MSIQKLYKFLFRASIAFTSIYCLVDTGLVQAQSITSDGTLPTPTEVTPTDAGFEINGGTTRGGNLFHSFGNFSVPSGLEAFFNNNLDVINILNRVTGGNVSDINGLIRANGGANLFLINPAGIVFGEGASLQIGGSFYGSTADSIVFPDGVEFSGTDSQAQPILTINAPIGLGFRDNPADITVKRDETGQSFANLTVEQGQNISLIGGNVSIDRGLISAPGGKVELGGLSVSGEVGINSDGSITFPEVVSRTDVSLTNGTFVDVRSNNGGSVTVNARNFKILGDSAIFAGIIPGNQQADAQAGDIVINATDKVSIGGEANSTSGIVNFVGDLSGPNFSSSIPTQGNAGNISINTDQLEGTGSFLIVSFANGEGNAGNVTVTARQSISLTGDVESTRAIASVIGPSALGNGADITITTPSLSISNGTGILTSTLGQGNAGNIFINATNSISLDNGSQLQAVTFSEGNAGNIVIDGENADIALNNQSLFSTSVFSGASGQGGDINITASSLSLANGAQLNAGTFGVGNAGGIELNTNSLSVNNGAKLSASTLGEGDAGTITINDAETVSFDGGLALSTVEATGVGTAGGIDITTTNLSLTNGGQLLAGTLGQGDAGNVAVNANSIFLDGQDNNGFPSAIFSRVGDPNQSIIPVGNAGGIELNTNSLSVNNGAQLSASTLGEGNAGTITINATETVSFDGGRAFSTVEATGVGTAGGINITTSNLFLTNGGQLLASTRGQGDAGNVMVNAKSIFLDGQDNQGFPSAIFSQVGDSDQSIIPVGNAGGIELNTNSLSVNNEASLSTSTFGKGNAGTITINDAETVSFDGGLALSTVEATGVGTAGGINITTSNLSLTNGGQLLATTRGQGDAGNVTVNANSIFLDGQDNNGFPSAIFSRVGDPNQSVIPVGNAGGIELNTNSLSLTNGAELSSSTFGQGNAGTININAAEISFDRALIAVDSQGEGQSGSLFIQADNLSLDNESSLLASTPVGTGGNIALEIAKVLSLKSNSTISAEATGDADGGNVNINAKFVVAFPDDGNGNDIIARAEDGVGGNVNITAEQVFNLEPGEATPGNGTNDIDVSSVFGLAGEVNIRTFTDDLLQGASELPENPVEPEQTVAQACSSQGIAEGENSFTVTGKGGVPPEPTDPFTADVINIEGEASVEQLQNRSSAGEENPLVNPRQQPQGILTSQGYIIPAQGIVRNKKGEIFLVGYPVDSSNQRTPVQSPNCGGK